MGKKIFFISLFILIKCSLFAQILNIDRENGQDTIFKKLRFSTELNFSVDKQRNNLIDLININEFSFSMKNNTIFVFFGRTDFAFNGNAALENNGYFQLRFRDNDSRLIYPDIFIQYQWNGVQGMEYRALIGANARIKWFEKNNADLYSKLGCFYEKEKWNPFLAAYGFAKDSVEIVFRDLVRVNTSLKFAKKIGSIVDVAMVNYAQFPVNKFFLQPRWFLDFNLNIQLAKHWAFVVHYDHTYDSYRALPIDNYFYALTFGCRYVL
jgi:hypothetical protein